MKSWSRSGSWKPAATVACKWPSSWAAASSESPIIRANLTPRSPRSRLRSSCEALRTRAGPRTTDLPTVLAASGRTLRQRPLEPHPELGVPRRRDGLDGEPELVEDLHRRQIVGQDLRIEPRDPVLPRDSREVADDVRADPLPLVSFPAEDDTPADVVPPV